MSNRLYKYYNMDQVVAQALAIYAQLSERTTWHPQADSPVDKPASPARSRNVSVGKHPLSLAGSTSADTGKQNGKSLSSTQNGSS